MRRNLGSLSCRELRVARNPRRPRTGFFLRAESYFNVATNIEELDREPGGGPPVIDSYGGVSLHEQSHGESFMALVRHRFGAEGLYVLDEPKRRRRRSVNSSSCRRRGARRAEP